MVGWAVVWATLPVLAQPAAQDDIYSTPAGVPLSIGAASGVLANDSGGLQAVLVTNVTNGLLLFNNAGGFFYLPNPGFSGNDSFTYQAVAGAATSNVATATISVIPAGGGNVPPVARADSYALNEGQPLNVVAASGVLANDTDVNGNPLTAVLIAGVSNGTLALQPDGSFSYTPPPQFNGSVTFAYQADDGLVRSNTATVTLTIAAVDDPPTAQADSYTTAEDTPLSIDGNGVLGNDSDPEGAPLTAVLVRAVSNGTLQLDAAGSFVYTPPANFNGTTSFTYRARDGSLDSAPATVTIGVSPVDDAPFISSSAPTTATEGVTYRYTLTASDPDGTTPTISAPTLPAWLTFQAPATISGTPSEDDAGTHAVTMRVTDGTAAPVEQRFEIAVTAVDNAPTIAAIPEQTATENTPFELDLARFVTDDDTELGELTYAAAAGVPSGLTLSAAGMLSGTPQIAASVGTHAVRFTVADATTKVPGQFTLAVLPAGRVDLTVTMSASPNPVPLGTPTSWTTTVTNRAPQVGAAGASLEVTFAGEVPFAFDPPPASSGCTLTPSAPQSQLKCSLGALAGGASTTVALTGRGSVAGDVFAAAKVAVAGAGALDEMPDNDTATASLSVAQRVAGAPAQRIELPDARAAAAGDFNGDGLDDLVVGTASAQGVVLFTNVADPANPGRRSFATPPQGLGGEALTTGVAVGDLDRDGDLDVVTAAANGAPDRVFTSGSGTFASTSLGNDGVESRAVAIGDIDGDGFPDLVFANPGTSTVLRNSGMAGVFTAGAGVGPHDARDVLLVDLLGDTLPELVIASGDGDAAIYRNAAGGFTLETTLTTGPTSAVASGDFNADGRADLVFARDTATPPAVPSSLVWLNTAGAASPFFAADELGAAETTRLLIHDFNLDSRTDVLALNGYGVRLFTDAGAGNGTLALHQLELATPGAAGAAAGHFNNDDRIDLAVVGDGVGLFFNDGAGDFGQPDSNPPTIQLRGDATVNVTIDAAYTDAGATAADIEDGDITSRIVVVNPVDTTVLGSYTVTYSVTDLSGNAAAPVSRTVNVQPQPAANEGGGGALRLEALALLLLALLRAAASALREAASRCRRVYATR